MTNQQVDDYEPLLEFAYQLAEQASSPIPSQAGVNPPGIGSHPQAIRGKMGQVSQIRVKEEYDRQTDQEVEELIKSAISQRYPSHKFIGEETYEVEGESVLTDEYTWIVDPIDGTMNFIHSNPLVGCSIGLLHRSIPVVGVIAQPFYGRIFSARLGGGAYLNKTTPLPLTGGIPQPLNSLSECIFSAEWGSDRSAKVLQKRAESFLQLAGDPSKGFAKGKMCHALRTTGSSTCSIVMVAAGEMDIYWDAGCYAWDVAAGAVIVSEAGGFFSGGKDGFKNDIPVGEAIMSRRYVFVRPVAPTANESAKDIQKRLVSELYDTVTEWTNSDM